MTKPISTAIFLSKIDMSAGPKGCWNWKCSTNNTGYGTVGVRGKTYCAHRIVAFMVGLVDSVNAPKDRTKTGFILHQCDNPKCCNPAHFKVGTYTQNQLEAYARKRRTQPRGHRHANAKLTPVQVRSIRGRYATGTISQDALAKMYGVSQIAISLIVRGETYK